MQSVKERFYDKVMFTEHCWVWTGALSASGYGHLAANGSHSQLAHRVSYSLFRGEIPDGMYVMHICDNRWCVNPAHLKLGTSTDNNRDKASKGRHNSPSKLTVDQRSVIATRFNRGESAANLSAEFGVTKQRVWELARNPEYTNA